MAITVIQISHLRLNISTDYMFKNVHDLKGINKFSSSSYQAKSSINEMHNVDKVVYYYHSNKYVLKQMALLCV